jgi:hypothetical protein
VKVPNAASAIVEEQKVRDYLLSSSHPVGRYKTRNFKSLGYDQEGWRRLASGLREILVANDVSESIANDYGTKYVVPGQLRVPNGAGAYVFTVWIILNEEDTPQLVTAYPGERDED